MSDLLQRLLSGGGGIRCIKGATALDQSKVPYDAAGHLGTQILLPFILEEELLPGSSAKATIHVFTPSGYTWTYEAFVFDDFQIGFYGSKGTRGVVFKYYNGERRQPGALSEHLPVDPAAFRHAIVNMQCGAPTTYQSPGEM